MEKLSIQTKNNRIAQYQKCIYELQYLPEDKVWTDLNDSEWLDLYSALNDMYDFKEIHKAFKQMQPAKYSSLLKKLREKAVLGPQHARDEREPFDRTPRDILFECVVLAKYKSQMGDIKPDLNSTADSGFFFKKKHVSVECKRPSSIKSIKQNVEKAISQLTEDFEILKKNSGKENPEIRNRGIIAFDISKLASETGAGGIIPLKMKQNEIESYCASINNQFLIKHYATLQELFKKADPKIIGILLRFKETVYAEDTRRIITAVDWLANSRSKEMNEDTKLLESLQIILKKDAARGDSEINTNYAAKSPIQIIKFGK